MSLERREFIRQGFAAGLLGLGALGSLGALGTLVGCSKVAAPAATAPAATTATAAPAAPAAQRWGLVIDPALLVKTQAFNAVAQACHSHHNVPQISDPKTEVKWIWQDDFAHCFEEMDSAYLPAALRELQFPVLCNHCENPVCVRVCPTQATFKRDDGIVDMDYHRCIGCRFCMTSCPYGARSLNFCDPQPYIAQVDPGYPTRMRGVVEKCNFCVERLAQGLPPHCVEASQGAILYGDLDDPASEVRQALAGSLSIRRRPELGTEPSVYYLLRGAESPTDAPKGGEPHA
ncbi:MAG: 4Fe-4S dicluster domain-containing protein [Coriobacteriia bacterium]|nr:4Fe-4S dicluster domain-containing protein [Coriobacteriia bacterium]